MALSVDQVVAILSPVKEAIDAETWNAAQERLGGQVDAMAGAGGDISDRKRWITVKDAAARCRVHYQTMLTWIAAGRVRWVKSGRHIFVDAATLPIRASEH